MEALPGSAHTVVHHGAVPVLCANLLEINFTDLAEQSLSTLEKISEELLSSIVCEGGLTALLQYLVCLSTYVQRTAVTAAANCCSSILSESFDMVRDVFPDLAQYSPQLLTPDVLSSLTALLSPLAAQKSVTTSFLRSSNPSPTSAEVVPNVRDFDWPNTTGNPGRTQSRPPVFGNGAEEEDSADDEFVLTEEGGRTGDWTPLSTGQIAIDSDALAFINARLPRINFPSWIKQPLSMLGKASHGKVKADEWRNLYSMQLPLILPLYWRAPDVQQLSLLHNFAHLVSLVNIGSKRHTESGLIAKYRHHLQAYLLTSVSIFNQETVAPNHHMAIHLAKCLEKFGPVRSWWAFPLERLMGQILKASHKNHIGELEITFLNNFCRLGNLRVLLNSDRLPDQLRPFIAQLRTCSDPVPRCIPKSVDPCRQKQLLSSKIFPQLITQINSIKSVNDNCTYVASSEWKRTDKLKKTAPVNRRVEFLQSVHVEPNLTYASYAVSHNNLIIQFRATSSRVATCFGRIDQIFKHKRVTLEKQTRTDVWLVVSQFRPIPPDIPHPFTSLVMYDLQLDLCYLKTHEPPVIHIEDVITHCAWIHYRAKEISTAFDQDCITLVSLDR
ncbi:hypothetical protein MJO29_014581 [Puccinia striiformis f. sp. tritici]|nr:hypothetical protein MJO29_014581 [Puccinia striiformis f. sp. tritici]